MPTKKKRLNLTLPKRVAVYLQKISLRDEMSQSQKALELIEAAMQIAEEEYFSIVAEERDTPDAKFVSHEEAWKHFQK